VADNAWLAEQFELARPRLHSMAYRMLGSVSDAEDAVQESWLRLDRSDAGLIDDLSRWLTTVVGRICLDMLRARKSRREDYVGTWLPEPVLSSGSESGPEHEAELADSVGLALLVVLESLSPPERLAFVLHDMFALPFDEISEIMDRTPDAARQLASRARRRVRGAPQPDADLVRQREVVDAFLAAARNGDFDALVKILAPDCVLRFDIRPDVAQGPYVGAETVARRVLATAPLFIGSARPAIVNGGAGVVFAPDAEPIAVLGVTVADGLIVTLDLVVDPAKLDHIALES